MEDVAAVRPVLAPVGLVAGVLAFGGVLVMLFASADPLAALLSDGGSSGPWAQALMVTAIVGLLSSILAYARREPRRLAAIGALLSVAALLAKHLIVAFLVFLVLSVVVSALTGG